MPPSAATRMRKDFLSILDLEPADLDRCIDLAAQMKADRPLGREAPTADALSGKQVAMLFEKASLRTWTTFEIAVRELGGNVVALQPDVGLGKREAVGDIALSLERWVHAVVVRTYSHRQLEQFASAVRPACVRTSPGKENGCDLKPFVAVQRVRHPPGKGAARQPEASLAWAAATLFVKRRRQMPKPCGKPRN